MTFWPSAKLSSSLSHCFRLQTAQHPERTFADMWPSGHPILLSSGRVSLIWALRLSGLTRGDTVRVFPFASHCVLDAVGRIATPAGFDSGDSATVHYHQWGFQRHLSHSVGQIVEDSVDSLYVPGAPLFASGGRFEIWSLSKILGTIGGGVLWCRNRDDAEHLAELITATKSRPNLRWALNAASSARQAPVLSAWWSAAEALSDGSPSARLVSEVQSRIRIWATLVAGRDARLRQITDSRVRILESPDRSHRLPCMLPVVTDKNRIEKLGGLGLPTELRHFMNNAGVMVPVYPLPIHQGISNVVFEKAISYLKA